MLLATDFVPCRGVAISSETDVAPCLAFLASRLRSCLVNLLFARCGDEAAPAPITTRHAIVRAPSATRTPPLKRDMLLPSPVVLATATPLRRSAGGRADPPPRSDRFFSI